MSQYWYGILYKLTLFMHLWHRKYAGTCTCTSLQAEGYMVRNEKTQ